MGDVSEPAALSDFKLEDSFACQIKVEEFESKPLKPLFDDSVTETEQPEPKALAVADPKAVEENTRLLQKEVARLMNVPKIFKLEKIKNRLEESPPDQKTI